MKRWLFGVVLVGLVLGRVSDRRGVLRPWRIAGGSMAETLVGEHFLVECADCDWRWRCGTQHAAAGDDVVCPNCGAEQRLRREQLRPGDRVQVDRFPLRLRPPRRGELLAFRRPDGTWGVKRVLGLPGERIAIRDGDLFADGRRVQKSLAELRAVAVPVHDDRFVPRSPLPPRWSGTDDSSWRRADGRYVGAAGAETEWLTYRHWRGFVGQGERTDEVRLVDNDSYNATLSRRLMPVHDLLLSGRVKTRGSGVLVLRLRSRSDTFELHWSVGSSRAVLLRNETRLVEATVPAKPERRFVGFEFACCDDQVLFAVEGRDVFIVARASSPSLRRQFTGAGSPSHDPTGPFVYRPAAGAGACGWAVNESHGRSSPVEIGLTQLAAELEDLRLHRDLHYLHPWNVPADWTAPAPLGRAAWFVLGDNCAISDDSRQAPDGVATRDILGLVLPPPARPGERHGASRRFPVSTGG